MSDVFVNSGDEFWNAGEQIEGLLEPDSLPLFERRRALGLLPHAGVGDFI